MTSVTKRKCLDANVNTTHKTRQVVSVNLQLPEDILIRILSHVSPDDLFNNCAYIKEWSTLVNSHSLWILKCEREGKIPKTVPRPLPNDFYKHLYSVRFGENLLKNPCGKEGLNHWKYDFREEYCCVDVKEMWIVENPPQGADELPNTKCQSCFVTKFAWCQKGQLIDLWEHGFSSLLFETLKLTIYISEWYISRMESGSQYGLEVSLLTDKQLLVKSHQFQHVESELNQRTWSKTEHEFRDVPSSVRYVYFFHEGMVADDTNSCKIAEGRVIVRLS